MLLHTTPSSDGPDRAAPETVRHAPEFHGRAGEYFGIWIVNVLLGILTLGIYSAWAKVRTERYFYGNTRLAGATFEYLADPIRILKGRLIAYAVVIALGVSSHFMPLLYLGLLLALFAVSPLIVFLALRFRARYSAWRGVRFGFDGGARAAYGPFLGWPILTSLSLSLLYPLMRVRQQAYVVDGHRFGTARFGFSGAPGAYYVPYLVTLGLGFLLVVSTLALMFALVLGSGVADTATPGAEPDMRQLAVIYVAILPTYLGMFALYGYLDTRYLNLLWANTRLGEHRFESTLRVRDVLWLYGTNLVAILCTLGLAIPWAQVRLARYRAAHFAVLANGSIDDFIADLEADRASAGAEVVDVLDLGVDIGL